MKIIIAILFSAAALLAQGPHIFTSYSEQANGAFLATGNLQDPSTVAGIPYFRLIYTNTKALDTNNGYADFYCYRQSSQVDDVWCYFLNSTSFLTGSWMGPWRLGSNVSPVFGPTMTWKPAESAFYVDPADPKKGRVVLSLSTIPGGPRVAFAFGLNSKGEWSFAKRISPECAVGEYSVGCTN